MAAASPKSREASNAADNATPFLIIAILIARNVFVAGAAVWAYLGENEGRISLLAIISLNVLWTIFRMITYFSYDKNDSDISLYSKSIDPNGCR